MPELICPNCGKVNPTSNKFCSQCGFSLPPPTSPSADIFSQPLVTGNSRRKNRIGAIVGIVAFVLILCGVFYFINHSPMDVVLSGISDELNKNCPVMIDSETQLDNTETLPGKVFQYNYSLVNISRGEADTAAMRSVLAPAILDAVKTSPELQLHRSLKTTMNYNYKDKNGNFLLLISVTPEMYQ